MRAGKTLYHWFEIRRKKTCTFLKNFKHTGNWSVTLPSLSDRNDICVIVGFFWFQMLSQVTDWLSWNVVYFWKLWDLVVNILHEKNTMQISSLACFYNPLTKMWIRSYLFVLFWLICFVFFFHFYFVFHRQNWSCTMWHKNHRYTHICIFNLWKPQSQTRLKRLSSSSSSSIPF